MTEIIAPPRDVPSGSRPPPPPEIDFEDGRLATRIGRALRGLAGIDEETVRWIWHERARYTSLGGVILGTATIAGVSMFNLISEIRPDTGWLALLPAVIWFGFVLNLDRWLVSSQGGQQVGAFLVRLTLAFLFGLLIAEPLVLRAFQPAIEQHIKDVRTDARAALTARLTTCNPESGRPPADCGGGDLLSFPTTPSADAAELAQLNTRADALQKEIDAESGRIADLQDEVQKECLGISGAGLTGRSGHGPECARRRAAVKVYKASHPLTTDQSRLAVINARIDSLTHKVTTSKQTFVAQRSQLITQRVGQLPDPRQAPDLLQRMQGLEDLIGTNPLLTVAAWVLRIFFVVVDCLPVLIKFLGGSTTYDTLAAARSSWSVTEFTSAAASASRDYARRLALAESELEAIERQRRAAEESEAAEARRRKEEEMVRRFEEARGRRGREAG